METEKATLLNATEMYTGKSSPMTADDQRDTLARKISAEVLQSMERDAKK